MQATPDMVRRVLRSWLATEVFTPHVKRNDWSGLAAEKQGQQRNRQSETADDPGLWADPGDNDLPPWPLRTEPNRTEWQSAGVFAVAAEMLPTRSASDWLGLDQMAPAR